jgi:Tannase and feruloyl esterase
MPDLMRGACVLLVIEMVIASALLSACNTPASNTPASMTPSHSGRDAPINIGPKRDCASLQGQSIGESAIALASRGARISSAMLVPASIPGPSPAGSSIPFTLSLPEYCKVLFEIAPVDPSAPLIRAQVNLPTRWRRATIQVGGGGLNGAIPANLAALGASGSPVSQANPPDTPYPLSRGYATFGGDSGHQGNDGAWALNDEAWQNFGHASLKKTHDAAFAVIELFYGERPRLSYFMGQSQGGREALEVAQRYPADYDGVVAVAPLIGYSPHVIAKTLLAAAQTRDGWVSPDKAKLAAAEVLRQCDELDGLRDGVIDHYRACDARFDGQHGTAPWSRIRCADGADRGMDCLSDAQIATVVQMHSATRFEFELANGLTDFPGYGTGREALGWLTISPKPGLPDRPNLGQPGTTVQFGIIKDVSLNLLNFTIGAHRERITAASRIIDSTNPNLSAFFDRGGKLIVKSSASDYSVNPRILYRYFETVQAQFGAAKMDQHVRLYVVPNGSHGGDSVSATTSVSVPHYVDLIGMMTDWVERAAIPVDAPVLRSMSRTPPFAVNATKIVCRYPKYPRYKGQGEPTDSRSYECTES